MLWLANETGLWCSHDDGRTWEFAADLPPPLPADLVWDGTDWWIA